jgi:hypothetical protein
MILVERKYFNGASCVARRNVKSFARFLRHITAFPSHSTLMITPHNQTTIGAGSSFKAGKT